jgi:hypothetical protein
MGMHADIGRRKRWAGKLRINAPNTAFVIGRYGCNCPVLREFDVDLPDSPELACAHHLARLPYHRESRKTMGHAKNHSRPALPFHEIECIRKIRCERLIANDVETPLEKGNTDFMMACIGRRNGNRIDAVGPLCLAHRHFLVARIGAFTRQIPIGGSIARPSRIR